MSGVSAARGRAVRGIRNRRLWYTGGGGEGLGGV